MYIVLNCSLMNDFLLIIKKISTTYEKIMNILKTIFNKVPYNGALLLMPMQHDSTNWMTLSSVGVCNRPRPSHGPMNDDNQVRMSSPRSYSSFVPEMDGPPTLSWALSCGCSRWGIYNGPEAIVPGRYYSCDV